MLRVMERFTKSIRARLEHKIYVPSLVLHALDTCNLRCANCGTAAPFLTDANLPDLESFVQSLSYLSRIMRSDELLIAGGEPLMNKDLCSFIRAARQSGIFREIRVITNGLLLHKMSEKFWQLADVVQISLYPSTRAALTDAKLESLKATASRHRSRIEVVLTTKFWKVNRDSRIEDDRIIQRNFSSCADAHEWSCHTIYRNHLYRCGAPHTLDSYLSKIGVEHENFTNEDGFLIDGRVSLLEEIKNYLNSEQPLKACSFCNGTPAQLEEHRQLSVNEIHSKLNSLVPDKLH